jgi:hypothetical protein
LPDNLRLKGKPLLIKIGYFPTAAYEISSSFGRGLGEPFSSWKIRFSQRGLVATTISIMAL